MPKGFNAALEGAKRCIIVCCLAHGGMALLAYFVGYAFGVFDDSPSWLGTPGARDCGFGVMIALFAAFLMLLLSKRSLLWKIFVELSQALPHVTGVGMLPQVF